MLRAIKNKKGLTLIEVLISMAFLTIIVLAFLNLYGTSFANIFSMGSKDNAMAKASDIMDTLYREQTDRGGFKNEGEIFEILRDDFGAHNPNNFSGDLFETDASYSGEYQITKKENFFDETEGYNVTISVFFITRTEQRNVTLTSFFRGSD